MTTRIAAIVFFVIYGFVLVYGEPAPDQLERVIAWQKVHDGQR